MFYFKNLTLELNILTFPSYILRRFNFTTTSSQFTTGFYDFTQFYGLIIILNIRVLTEWKTQGEYTSVALYLTLNYCTDGHDGGLQRPKHVNKNKLDGGWKNLLSHFAVLNHVYLIWLVKTFNHQKMGHWKI
jgi:hypothetical protein